MSIKGSTEFRSPKGSIESVSKLPSPKQSDAEAEVNRLERLSVFTAQKIKALQYQSPERDSAYEIGRVQPVGGFMHLLAPKSMGDQGEDGSQKDDLVKQRLLPLWIPDTVVWGPEGKPTWYYTNSDGFLHKTTDFGMSHVCKRFQKKQSPQEPVAVLKIMNGSKNLSSLVDTTKLKEIVETQGCPQMPVVLQRFIWPKGLRAGVYRCCWTTRTPVFHVNCIRSKQSITDEDATKETRLLPSSMQPKYIESYEMKVAAIPGISKAMKNLLQYLGEEKHLLLDELVCDFLVDNCSHVWFSQVKAFTPRQTTAGPKRALSLLEVDDPGPGVREFCGFCGCVFRQQDLEHLLTVRQVLEIHERLRSCGIQLSWERSPQMLRLATRPTTVSGPMLRVCESCRGLHNALAELTAVSTAFHARLGVPSAPTFASLKVENVKKPSSSEVAVLWEPKAPDAIRRSPSAPAASMVISMSPTPQMPRSWQWQLSSSDPVTVMRAHGPGVSHPKSAEASHEPPRRLMLRYRILLLLQELWLLKPDAVPDETSLTVVFTLFGVKHRVPVRVVSPRDNKTSGANDAVRQLDCMRVMHVFVSRAESLAKWARKHTPVELRVMSGRETLFVAMLPLRRIATVAEAHDKGLKALKLALQDAEMQFVDLPLHRPGFRVEEGRLRAVFGTSAGAAAYCEHVSLRLESGLVYVPPQTFTVPEELPPLWLDVLTYQKSGHRQNRLKGQPHDAIQSDSQEYGLPARIETAVTPRVILNFRLRGLHGLPGAQPGDPYMVELVIFGIVKVRQQTFCIERNRPSRDGETEVLAPVQLDACVALDDLSTDSLRATLRREDAAHVRSVRRGGKSALCPALQVALPLDRLEHSGAKRITGAFELSPPPEAPAGGGRGGALAHLFAGFSAEVPKGECMPGIPVLGPVNEREERLAGVGSEIPPTLVLRESGNVDRDVPQVTGRGVERTNKPLICRASTQLGATQGSQLSAHHRSRRSVFRSDRPRSRDSNQAAEDDDDSSSDDDVDSSANRSENSNADYDEEAELEVGHETSVTSVGDKQTQEVTRKGSSSSSSSLLDDAFGAFVEEHTKADPKLSSFCAGLPRRQLRKLMCAFTAYSSTSDYSTGRLRTEDLSKVFGDLGYETGAYQYDLEAACVDLRIVNLRTKDIGFEGFLALMEAYFRDLVEVNDSESAHTRSRSSSSCSKEDEPMVLAL